MGARQMITAAALAIGLGALGAAAAFAEEPAAASQPTKAKPDGSRRVCRLVVPTGSRMSSRICRTQAEWDSSRDKTADNFLQQQRTHETLLEQADRGM
ncbi:MAG: hypothetical protein QOJ27_302 [Sphingomonadales bacterium]|nr:hypothetical protein [Sphingomonadales bacterium]